MQCVALFPSVKHTYQVYPFVTQWGEELQALAVDGCYKGHYLTVFDGNVDVETYSLYTLTVGVTDDDTQNVTVAVAEKQPTLAYVQQRCAELFAGK